MGDERLIVGTGQHYLQEIEDPGTEFSFARGKVEIERSLKVLIVSHSFKFTPHRTESSPPLSKRLRIMRRDVLNVLYEKLTR